MTFRFSKRERLLKRSDFLTVQKFGVKLHGTHFVIVVRRRDERVTAEATVGRVGITVSKKVGTAVQRNRIKRMVREFVRLNRGWVPEGCDVVVIAKRSAATLTGLAEVTADLRRVERRLARC